jgi:hypothetical protein
LYAIRIFCLLQRLSKPDEFFAAIDTANLPSISWVHLILEFLVEHAKHQRPAETRKSATPLWTVRKKTETPQNKESTHGSGFFTLQSAAPAALPPADVVTKAHYSDITCFLLAALVLFAEHRKALPIFCMTEVDDFLTLLGYEMSKEGNEYLVMSNKASTSLYGSTKKLNKEEKVRLKEGAHQQREIEGSFALSPSKSRHHRSFDPFTSAFLEEPMTRRLRYLGTLFDLCSYIDPSTNSQRRFSHRSKNLEFKKNAVKLFRCLSDQADFITALCRMDDPNASVCESVGFVKFLLLDTEKTRDQLGINEDINAIVRLLSCNERLKAQLQEVSNMVAEFPHHVLHPDLCGEVRSAYIDPRSVPTVIVDDDEIEIVGTPVWEEWVQETKEKMAWKQNTEGYRVMHQMTVSDVRDILEGLGYSSAGAATDGLWLRDDTEPVMWGRGGKPMLHFTSYFSKYCIDVGAGTIDAYCFGASDDEQLMWTSICGTRDRLPFAMGRREICGEGSYCFFEEFVLPSQQKSAPCSPRINLLKPTETELGHTETAGFSELTVDTRAPARSVSPQNSSVASASPLTLGVAALKPAPSQQHYHFKSAQELRGAVESKAREFAKKIVRMFYLKDKLSAGHIEIPFGFTGAAREKWGCTYKYTVSSNSNEILSIHICRIVNEWWMPMFCSYMNDNTTSITDNDENVVTTSVIDEISSVSEGYKVASMFDDVALRFLSECNHSDFQFHNGRDNTVKLRIGRSSVVFGLLSLKTKQEGTEPGKTELEVSMGYNTPFKGFSLDGENQSWTVGEKPNLQVWRLYVRQLLKEKQEWFGQLDDVVMIGIGYIVRVLEGTKKKQRVTDGIFTPKSLLSILEKAVAAWHEGLETYGREALQHASCLVILSEILGVCLGEQSHFMLRERYMFGSRGYHTSWAVGRFIENWNLKHTAPLIYVDDSPLVATDPRIRASRKPVRRSIVSGGQLAGTPKNRKSNILQRISSHLFNEMDRESLKTMTIAELRTCGGPQKNMQLYGVVTDGFNILPEDAKLCGEPDRPDVLCFNKLENIKIDCGSMELGMHGFCHHNEDYKSVITDSTDDCKMPPFVMASLKVPYDEGLDFFDMFVLRGNDSGDGDAAGAAKNGIQFATLLVDTFKLNDEWVKKLTVRIGITGTNRERFNADEGGIRALFQNHFLKALRESLKKDYNVDSDLSLDDDLSGKDGRDVEAKFEYTAVRLIGSQIMAKSQEVTRRRSVSRAKSSQMMVPLERSGNSGRNLVKAVSSAGSSFEGQPFQYDKAFLDTQSNSSRNFFDPSPFDRGIFDRSPSSIFKRQATQMMPLSPGTPRHQVSQRRVLSRQSTATTLKLGVHSTSTVMGAKTSTEVTLSLGSRTPLLPPAMWEKGTVPDLKQWVEHVQGVLKEHEGDLAPEKLAEQSSLVLILGTAGTAHIVSCARHILTAKQKKLSIVKRLDAAAEEWLRLENLKVPESRYSEGALGDVSGMILLREILEYTIDRMEAHAMQVDFQARRGYEVDGQKIEAMWTVGAYIESTKQDLREEKKRMRRLLEGRDELDASSSKKDVNNLMKIYNDRASECLEIVNARCQNVTDSNWLGEPDGSGIESDFLESLLRISLDGLLRVRLTTFKDELLRWEKKGSRGIKACCFERVYDWTSATASIDKEVVQMTSVLIKVAIAEVQSHTPSR